MKESGLMFMRNINNLKRSARKLAAAMLSVVTAVTLMPVQAVQGKGTSHLALGVADINTLNVSLTVSASVQRALDAGLKNNSGREDVIRAVLDDIEELPQYGNLDLHQSQEVRRKDPLSYLRLLRLRSAVNWDIL